MVEPLTAGKPPRPYRGGMIQPEETMEEQDAREAEEQLSYTAAEDLDSPFPQGVDLVTMDQTEWLGTEINQPRNMTGNTAVERQAGIVLDSMLTKQPIAIVQREFDELQDMLSSEANDANYTIPPQNVVNHNALTRFVSRYVVPQNYEDFKQFTNAQLRTTPPPFEWEQRFLAGTTQPNELNEMIASVEPYMRIFGPTPMRRKGTTNDYLAENLIKQGTPDSQKMHRTAIMLRRAANIPLPFN